MAAQRIADHGALERVAILAVDLLPRCGEVGVFAFELLHARFELFHGFGLALCVG